MVKPEQPPTREPSPDRRRLLGWARRRGVAPYLFISPFYAIYAAFLLGPTLFAFWLSFHSWDGISEKEWVGAQNYTDLIDDAAFTAAAENTVIYVIASLFVLCPLALMLAVVLNSRIVRFRDVFRVVYFIPIVVSPIVISIMFTLVFDRNFGLLNAVWNGVFGFEPIPWLSSPTWAKVAIIIVLIWRYTGYIMIFFLAGLQGIPADLYEAARVAGANSWQEFRYVTLPLLKPVVAFMAIVILIGAAQIFEEPFILTGGGPADSTLSVAQFVYREGLTNIRLGYASAASVVLFAAIFVMTLLMLRVFKVGRED
jgi:multiple sugar transport system permease protein